MAQTWELPVDTDNLLETILGQFNDGLETLRTQHSGSAEPTSPVAYMFWADTANNVLKQRNAGNTAWTAILAMNAANQNQTSMVAIGAVSASQDNFIFTPNEAVTIDEVTLISSVAVTANDTNYWSFQVANLTQADDLLAAAQTTQATGGAGITADEAFSITPDQNASIAAGDVLELQITETGTATSLAGVVVAVHYHLTGA